MSKYIEAETYKAAHKNVCESAMMGRVYEAVVKSVDVFPAADVIEVVRCKDCKHWDKTWTNDWSPDYHYCPIIDGVRKGDFYCADAEHQ